MNAQALPLRLDYLDAVRAFALLLGIVFHASMSFLPIFIGWAVMDISTSSSVSTFMLVSHSFRMELFFLIAGYFSHMTFHKKGAGTFAQSRLVRIALPFVVGWFILRPLIVSGWAMGGQSLQGDVDILGGLKIGFMSLAELPAGLFTGSHLWFLYYLLMITAGVLLLRAMLSRIPRVYAACARAADTIVGWIARSPFAWFALCVPTGACLWFMSGWGMDTPDLSMVPHVPVLILYSGLFSLGWLLHRQAELMTAFARLSAGRFVLCAGSVVGAIMLSGFQTDVGHPRFELLRGGFVVCYALMMWSLVALSIGLFKRFLDRPSPVVRYIADASYWLYLIHLPVVVWLQVAFAELPLHWAVKLASISILTIGLSLLLYDLFVRSTLIGKTLNGRRKARALFRQRDASQLEVSETA